MKRKFILLSALCLGLAYTSFGQLNETFEGTSGTSLPSGWTQTSSTTGWVSGTSSTLSSSAYAPTSHTRFVGVNDDQDSTLQNTSDMLKSPSFSLSGVSGAYLSFDLFYVGGSYGGASESFVVKISTNGGTSWTTLQSFDGNPSGGWETKHISLAAYNNTSNLMLAFVYSDGGGWEWGASIDNVVVAVPPATDLAITSLSPAANSIAAYGAAGGRVPMRVTVTNNGSTPVSSFTFGYQVGSGSAATSTVNIPTINVFQSYTFDYDGTAPNTVSNNVPVKTWISLSGDNVASNDSANTSVNLVSFLPNKRLMFEEFTGSWCGFCVRGIVWMDSLRTLHGDNVSIVAVHDYNGYDTMAHENTLTTDYDAYTGGVLNAAAQQGIQAGYPSIYIDRSYLLDPSSALPAYDALKNDFGFANLNVNAYVSNSNIYVSANVTPAVDMNGDYRLALVVTEDDVTGTSQGYQQVNYYSSNGGHGFVDGDLVGQGVNYYNEPFQIPGVKYQFVARYTIPDMNTSPGGIASSLPTSMTANNTYSFDFAAIPVPQDWNVNKLKVVAMLIDNNTNSGTANQVLNSNRTEWTVGVANVNAGLNSVTLFPNPANELAYLRFNVETASTINIVVTDAVGRTVYVAPSRQMNAGEQIVKIPTTSLAAGVYNVTLSTDKGSVTQRLSVAK